MATPTVTSADAIPFRVLYLFAGKARQADFGNALRSVVETWNDDASAVRISLHLEEIDTLRGGLAHDLLKEPARTDIPRRIRAGEFDLVMVAPPCNTFSRAVFREGAGPKPVRSKQWPDGFPWLEGYARVRAEEGSVLTAFATQALAAAGEAKHEDPWRCTRRWGEFPEDLGRAHPGTPASWWQRSDLRAIPRLERRAIFQCEWAPVNYAKPTGIITDVIGFFEGKPSHVGWPSFDDQDVYLGPLPPTCPHTGHVPLKGLSEDGSWKTSPTGAYPEEICLHIAVKAFADFCARISTQVDTSAPADGGFSSAGSTGVPLHGPFQHLENLILAVGPSPLTMPGVMCRAHRSHSDCGSTGRAFRCARADRWTSRSYRRSTPSSPTRSRSTGSTWCGHQCS